MEVMTKKMPRCYKIKFTQNIGFQQIPSEYKWGEEQSMEIYQRKTQLQVSVNPQTFTDRLYSPSFTLLNLYTFSL